MMTDEFDSMKFVRRANELQELDCEIDRLLGHKHIMNAHNKSQRDDWTTIPNYTSDPYDMQLLDEAMETMEFILISISRDSESLWTAAYGKPGTTLSAPAEGYSTMTEALAVAARNILNAVAKQGG